MLCHSFQEPKIILLQYKNYALNHPYLQFTYCLYSAYFFSVQEPEHSEGDDHHTNLTMTALPTTALF